jgi:DNA-binding response OmpR family regulator
MKPRICLIEDDPIMGEALAERLDMEGYDCDWLQCGDHALAALRQRRYAVAVSDIRLPDMSGEALFEKLLGEGLELPPFLFITGHGAIDQAVRLLKLGAQDYLAKPLDIPLLLAKVRELAERARPRGNGADALPRGLRALPGQLASLSGWMGQFTAQMKSTRGRWT